jgi:hypothetical protein
MAVDGQHKHLFGPPLRGYRGKGYVTLRLAVALLVWGLSH